MLIKEHRKDGRLVVALCDASLLGKRVTEGDISLDLDTPFYRGKEADLARLPTILRSSQSINAVGEESVAFLVKEGFVDDAGVKRAEGVPFVHVFFM